ncbi:hypothetical protein EDC04DRAFT_3089159 [Pisolithus marmoratus]|nr:hypothetical protein EDC04DRAFT_3089159 [Pisolithus marmoratus]
MPLDGYTYLTSYGWTGKGTGLRNGAIEKPISIPQKRNLAGVGKDRDEAFPFWDHLFAVASKAITIKVVSDDDDNENDEDLPKNEPLDIKRTSTGIISNRRPVTGTPSSESASGTATPDLYVGPKLSLIAAAKREAVKRGLYSRFFRGPVLGPDNDSSTCTTTATSTSPTSSESTPQPAEKKSKRRRSEGSPETKEERRERKRLKRERKEARRLKKETKAEAVESLRHHDIAAEGTDVSPSERGLRLKPSKKKQKMARENGLEGEDFENELGTREGLVKDNGIPTQDVPLCHVSRSSCENPDVGLNSKKKKGKRKHSNCRSVS